MQSSTSMISLGNHQRSPRFSLPGSVSAGQLHSLKNNRRSRLTNRISAAANPAARVSPPNSVSETSTPSVNSKRTAPPSSAPACAPACAPVCAPACAPAPMEDLHWVWANAMAALTDVQNGEKVCDAGTRVLLVYPMQADPQTGSIRMRLRNVDPDTGQPTVCWVEVYDPITETRHLSSFSLSA